MIREQLRATLLSLKLISDRIKSLITTSVTKSELSTAKQEVIDSIDEIDIDTSDLAKEATLETVGLDAAAAKTAAQGITGYALQGSDATATNTAILAAINTIPNLKVLYSARFEQNQDGQDTCTVVLPIVAGVEESESGNSVIVTI